MFSDSVRSFLIEVYPVVGDTVQNVLVPGLPHSLSDCRIESSQTKTNQKQFIMV